MTDTVNNLLLTGASGFIGSSLLNHLAIDCRFLTTAVARKDIVVKGDRISFKQLSDISRTTDWSEVLDNIDCVLHVAGLAHIESKSTSVIGDVFREVNVAVTLNLARQAAAHGVNRFIFVSSIGVYGSHSALPFTEVSIPAPHTQYAESKLEAEVELQKLANELSFDLVIVRPVLVYGSEAPGNFGQLAKLVKLTPILPFGLCNNLRSFVSVDNLADFLLLCAVHPSAANQDFVISDAEDVSIKQLTHAMAKGLKRNLIQLPVPYSLMRFVAKLLRKEKHVEQLLGNLQVDCSKAKHLLGWQPLETLEQAMSKLSSSTLSK